MVRVDVEDNRPTVSLAVLSPTVDLRELTSLTDQTIVKAIENIPGVAQVDVNGRVTRQILIQIKPSQLASLGIGVDQVMTAVQNANQDVPAGRITRGQNDSVVRVEGKIKDPAQFGRIIVAQQGGGPVYLSPGRRRDRRREGARLDLAHQWPAVDHHRHPQGAGREHRRDRPRRQRRDPGAESRACRRTSKCSVVYSQADAGRGQRRRASRTRSSKARC